LIPEKAEPAFWVIIFIFCAWVIAKVCPGKYFLHGFLVSMVNSIWITAVHVFFRTTYVVNHPNVAGVNSGMPPFMLIHPRLAMIIMGPVFGLMFGIILGIFALVASKIVKKTTFE
jgi:hypothetical protein